MRGVHADDRLKLRNYWTEVHQIYIQCSQIITDEHCEIRMAIAIQSGMSGLRIKANSPILPIFYRKIGYHGNVRKAIKKGGQIGNQLSNTYHAVKTR